MMSAAGSREIRFGMSRIIGVAQTLARGGISFLLEGLSNTGTRQFQKYWNGRSSLGAKDKAGRSIISEIDE